MAVRAKFKVYSINRSSGQRRKRDGAGNYVKNDRGHDQYEPCEQWTIRMSPVYGNNDPAHENSKFWDATPGGSIEMACVNADAVRQFDLDKEFYVDFTPAE